MAFLLLCVIFFVGNEAGKGKGKPSSKPSKPSKPTSALSDGELIDVLVTSEPISSCITCILAGGFTCATQCIPNPFTTKCFQCVVTNLPQCLGPCGFPRAHAEFNNCFENCQAKLSNTTGDCTILVDNCGNCVAT